jgi:hypothetical protein
VELTDISGTKKEYLKDKNTEPETNCRNKEFRDMYTGTRRVTNIKLTQKMMTMLVYFQIPLSE